MNHPLFATADQYISGVLSIEDTTLQTTERLIAEANLPHNMSISPNQGQFLLFLARLARTGRILELGTFVGYSTIWLTRGLLPGGRLISLEFDPVHAAIARRNLESAGLSDKVDIRVGKALDLLPGLLHEGPFDMIFIDADKPPYAEYLQWAMRLSRPGTLIVVDNVVKYILDEETPEEKVEGIRRFHSLVKSLVDEAKITASIIQSVGIKEHDGMALIVVS